MLEGRVVLVTGATVLIHGRTASRCDAVRSEIAEATWSRRLDTLVAHLASLRQIRDMAAQLAQKYDRLHVLVHNAGVYGRENEEQ